MSYMKVANPMPGIADVLPQLMVFAGIDDTILTSVLYAAGVTVELEDGTHVWVTSIANDDPTTPFIELLTMAIAGDASGPRMHFGGPLSRVFTHSVPPALVAEIGLDDIRRQLQLVALGEYTITEDHWLQFLPAALADRSIRVAIVAANEVNAEQGDVL